LNKHATFPTLCEKTTHGKKAQGKPPHPDVGNDQDGAQGSVLAKTAALAPDQDEVLITITGEL
jgi:hypothetical protein